MSRAAKKLQKESEYVEYKVDPKYLKEVDKKHVDEKISQDSIKSEFNFKKNKAVAKQIRNSKVSRDPEIREARRNFVEDSFSSKDRNFKIVEVERHPKAIAAHAKRIEKQIVKTIVEEKFKDEDKLKTNPKEVFEGLDDYVETHDEEMRRLKAERAQAKIDAYNAELESFANKSEIKIDEVVSDDLKPKPKELLKVRSIKEIRKNPKMDLTAPNYNEVRMLELEKIRKAKEQSRNDRRNYRNMSKQEAQKVRQFGVIHKAEMAMIEVTVDHLKIEQEEKEKARIAKHQAKRTEKKVLKKEQQANKLRHAAVHAAIMKDRLIKRVAKKEARKERKTYQGEAFTTYGDDIECDYTGEDDSDEIKCTICERFVLFTVSSFVRIFNTDVYKIGNLSCCEQSAYIEWNNELFDLLAKGAVTRQEILVSKPEKEYHKSLTVSCSWCLERTTYTIPEIEAVRAKDLDSRSCCEDCLLEMIECEDFVGESNSAQETKELENAIFVEEEEMARRIKERQRQIDADAEVARKLQEATVELTRRNIEESDKQRKLENERFLDMIKKLDKDKIRAKNLKRSPFMKKMSHYFDTTGIEKMVKSMKEGTAESMNKFVGFIQSTTTKVNEYENSLNKWLTDQSVDPNWILDIEATILFLYQISRCRDFSDYYSVAFLFTRAVLTDGIIKTHALAGSIAAMARVLAKTPKDEYVGEAWSDSVDSVMTILTSGVESTIFNTVKKMIGGIFALKFFKKETAIKVYDYIGKPEGNTILDHVLAILSGLKSCLDVAESWWKGDGIESAFAKDPVYAMRSEASRLLHYKDRLYSGFPAPGHMDRADFIKEGSKVLDYYRKYKATHPGFNKDKKEAQDLYWSLEEAVHVAQTYVNSRMRPMPVGIVNYGPPDIGKSSITQVLYKVFCLARGYDFTPDMVYTRDTTDEFWSNYNSWYKILRFPEIGNLHKKIAASVGDPVALELLSVMDRMPKATNQPKLNDKGTVFVQAELIVADTNVADMNFKEIANVPGAYFRRFWQLESRVDPSVTKDGGSGLDPLKCPEKDLYDKWLFTLRLPRMVGNQCVYYTVVEDVSVYDLCEALYVLFVEHFKNEKQILAREENEDIRKYFRNRDQFEPMDDYLVERYTEKLKQNPEAQKVTKKFDISLVAGLFDLNNEIESPPDFIDGTDHDLIDSTFQGEAWGDVQRWNPLGKSCGHSVFYDCGCPERPPPDHYPEFDPPKKGLLSSLKTNIYCMTEWTTATYLVSRNLIRECASLYRFHYYTHVKALMGPVYNITCLLTDLVKLFVFFTIFKQILVWPVALALAMGFSFPFERMAVDHKLEVELAERRESTTAAIKYNYQWLQAHFGMFKFTLPKPKELVILVSGLTFAIGALYGAKKLVDTVRGRKETPYAGEATGFVNASEHDQKINDIEEKAMCGKSVTWIKNKVTNVWSTFDSTGLDWTSNLKQLQKVHEAAPKILRNSKFCVVTDAKGKVNRAHILGVKSMYALMPSHLLKGDGPWDVKAYTGGKLDETGPYIPVRITRDDLKILENDTTFVKMVGLQFADITKNIYHGPVNQADGWIAGNYITVKPDRHVVNFAGLPKVLDCVNYKWHEHTLGMCGIPVFADVGKTWAIVALHNGGKPHSMDCSASLIPSFMPYIGESCLVDYNSRGEIIQTLPPAKKSLVHYENIECMEYLGRDGGRIEIKNKSRLQLTGLPAQDILMEAFQEEIEDDSAKPAMMPCGSGKNYKSPWNTAFRKMSRKRKTLDSKILEEIVRLYIEHVVERTGPHICSPYDLETAINGSEFDDFIRRINVKTAAGYGLKGKKKDYLPLVDEIMRELTPELRAEVARMCAIYEKGEVCNVIFSSSLKDEPRPISKVIELDTRLFYPSPLIFLILCRMFLGPIFTQLQRDGDTFGTALGIDMHRQAQELFDKLKEYEDIMEGDYGAYDLGMPFGISWAAASVIYGLAKAWGYSEYALKIVLGLLSEMLFAKVEILSDIFEILGIQPSGAYDTVVINTIRGRLMLMYYAAYNGIDFFKNIMDVIFGDDVLAGVSKQVREIFNSIKYADFVRDVFGMDFTSATKGKVLEPFVSKKDMSFLKRKFIHHPDLKDIRAPLAKTSLVKMIKWRMPGDVPVITQMNDITRAFSRELYLFGQRDAYNRGRRMYMEKFKEAYNVECEHFLEYDDYTDIFSQEEAKHVTLENVHIVPIGVSNNYKFDFNDIAGENPRYKFIVEGEEDKLGPLSL